MGKYDRYKFKSPIKITQEMSEMEMLQRQIDEGNDIQKQFVENFDKAVLDQTCKVAAEVGIEVNPERLKEALIGESKQYERGYEDGYKDGTEAGAEKYKLALFAVVRNSLVAPMFMCKEQDGTGKINYHKDEVNIIAKKTLDEIVGMCDFDSLKESWESIKE